MRTSRSDHHLDYSNFVVDAQLAFSFYQLIKLRSTQFYLLLCQFKVSVECQFLVDISTQIFQLGGVDHGSIVDVDRFVYIRLHLEIFSKVLPTPQEWESMVVTPAYCSRTTLCWDVCSVNVERLQRGNCTLRYSHSSVIVKMWSFLYSQLSVIQDVSTILIMLVEYSSWSIISFNSIVYLVPFVLCQQQHLLLREATRLEAEMLSWWCAECACFYLDSDSNLSYPSIKLEDAVEGSLSQLASSSCQ